MEKLKLTGLRSTFQPALTAFPGWSRSAKATSWPVLGTPPWSVGFRLLCPYYTPEPGVTRLGSVSLHQLQKCRKKHDDDADLLQSIVPSTRLKGGSAEGKRDSFRNRQALQSTVFKTCVVALGYLALDASSRSFVSASTCWYGME